MTKHKSSYFQTVLLNFFDSRANQEIFSPLQIAKIGSGNQPVSSSVGTGSKSAVIMNAWSFISTPPYCCLAVIGITLLSRANILIMIY
jgi:hypothetical protein